MSLVSLIIAREKDALKVRLYQASQIMTTVAAGALQISSVIYPSCGTV